MTTHLSGGGNSTSERWVARARAPGGAPLDLAMGRGSRSRKTVRSVSQRRGGSRGVSSLSPVTLENHANMFLFFCFCNPFGEISIRLAKTPTRNGGSAYIGGWAAAAVSQPADEVLNVDRARRILVRSARGKKNPTKRFNIEYITFQLGTDHQSSNWLAWCWFSALVHCLRQPFLSAGPLIGPSYTCASAVLRHPERNCLIPFL